MPEDKEYIDSLGEDVTDEVSIPHLPYLTEGPYPIGRLIFFKNYRPLQVEDPSRLTVDLGFLKFKMELVSKDKFEQDFNNGLRFLDNNTLVEAAIIISSEFEIYNTFICHVTEESTGKELAFVMRYLLSSTCERLNESFDLRINLKIFLQAFRPVQPSEYTNQPGGNVDSLNPVFNLKKIVTKSLATGAIMGTALTHHLSISNYNIAAPGDMPAIRLYNEGMNLNEHTSINRAADQTDFSGDRMLEQAKELGPFDFDEDALARHIYPAGTIPFVSNFFDE